MEANSNVFELRRDKKRPKDEEVLLGRWLASDQLYIHLSKSGEHWLMFRLTPDQKIPAEIFPSRLNPTAGYDLILKTV